MTLETHSMRFVDIRKPCELNTACYAMAAKQCAQRRIRQSCSRSRNARFAGTETRARLTDEQIEAATEVGEE